MQFKTTWHVQKLEYLNLYGKRQSTHATTKMAQILELSDKDFQVTTLNMFQQANTNIIETNGKIESLKKETEDVIKNKMNI